MNLEIQNLRQRKKLHQKRSKTGKFLIKAAIGSSPLVFLGGVLILFNVLIGMYFSNGALSEFLSESENAKLIDHAKSKIDSISGEMKDYYNTDKRFRLEYQYVLAFTKYTNASEDYISSKGQHTFKELEKLIDDTVNLLKPKLDYKKDSIKTVRQYKEVIVDPETGEQREEMKTESSEEQAFFLINAKTIRATFSFSYETKTETIEKGEETITVTKPVISGMQQTDKDWDVLKQIIAAKYKEEDSEKAAEVILASAASYINENVTEDMIFTGGGALISPEQFTGGQAEFIQKVAEGAIDSYKKYNIFPSITIAQAILESGWGQSGLTGKGNNLFGVKAYGWNGAVVDMLTAEYNSDGSKYYVVASFRGYNSWAESIEDHSKVLLNDRYADVRSATNYRAAAEALRAGGYATDPEYPQLLISIIESYGLYQYDK
jgi:flagellum-specific peptidoglycan hydrolase FlgJ